MKTFSSRNTVSFALSEMRYFADENGVRLQQLWVADQEAGKTEWRDVPTVSAAAHPTAAE